MKGVGVGACRSRRAPGGLRVTADEGVEVGVVSVEQGVGAAASFGHEPKKHRKFNLEAHLFITPDRFLSIFLQALQLGIIVFILDKILDIHKNYKRKSEFVVIL